MYEKRKPNKDATDVFSTDATAENELTGSTANQEIPEIPSSSDDGPENHSHVESEEKPEGRENEW